MTEFSPSAELNNIFTPLVTALAEKVATHGIARATYPDMHVSFTWLNSPFDQYPEIFRQAEQRQYMMTSPAMITPIGEYGSGWAAGLARHGADLIHTATDPSSPAHILDEIEELSADQREVTDYYTFRRTRRLDPSGTFNTFGEHKTMNDAAQANTFASAFFTTYRIPEYDSPQVLLKELATDGVYSQLAQVIPFSITATLGTSGGTFTSPVVERNPARHNKWEVRSDILDHFRWGLKAGIYDRFSGGRKKLDRPGCPLARKIRDAQISGVDQYAGKLTIFIMKVASVVMYVIVVRICTRGAHRSKFRRLYRQIWPEVRSVRRQGATLV